MYNGGGGGAGRKSLEGGQPGLEDFMRRKKNKEHIYMERGGSKNFREGGRRYDYRKNARRDEREKFKFSVARVSSIRDTKEKSSYKWRVEGKRRG